jgi:hypothetical protein
VVERQLGGDPRVQRRLRGRGSAGLLQRVRATDEGPVPGHVIRVGVSVCHDQLVAGSRTGRQPVGHEPVDGLPQGIVVDRSGVEQQGPVLPEQEEGEGGLEVGILALPHDDGVVPVVMDLPRWVLSSTTMAPLAVQDRSPRSTPQP